MANIKKWADQKTEGTKEHAVHRDSATVTVWGKTTSAPLNFNMRIASVIGNPYYLVPCLSSWEIVMWYVELKINES